MILPLKLIEEKYLESDSWLLYITFPVPVHIFLFFPICTFSCVKLWFSKVLKVRAWLCWFCDCHDSQDRLLGVSLGGVLSLVSSMAASHLWGHHHLQDWKEEVECTVLGATQGWALAGEFTASLHLPLACICGTAYGWGNFSNRFSSRGTPCLWFIACVDIQSLDLHHPKAGEKMRLFILTELIASIEINSMWGSKHCLHIVTLSVEHSVEFELWL